MVILSGGSGHQNRFKRNMIVLFYFIYRFSISNKPCLYLSTTANFRKTHINLCIFKLLLNIIYHITFIKNAENSLKATNADIHINVTQQRP